MPWLCLSLSGPRKSKRKGAAIADSISIVTEGSPEMGFGHLRRSVTLAQELKGRAQVKLWIFGRETRGQLASGVLNHLTDLDWNSGPEPKGLQNAVRILDLEQNSHRQMLTTSPDLTRDVALDWFDPEILPRSAINLLDHSGRMKAAYEAAGRARDYYEGPGYAIIRPSLLALKSKFPVESKTVRRVIITPGGADPARQGMAALHLLSGHKDLELVLVMGPLVPEDYERELRAAAPANVLLLRNPADFDRRLAASDVVLCSGGGSLLESLALGKPTVVFPQTEAEKAHARSHAEAGACVFADHTDVVLRDADLRQSLIEKARLRVDGEGAKRIAEIALRISRHTTPQS